MCKALTKIKCELLRQLAWSQTWKNVHFIYKFFNINISCNFNKIDE